MEDKTICALSTPVGTGGLAVIRVSGLRAISIVERIFKGRRLSEVPSHQAVHGYIVDPGIEDEGEKSDNSRHAGKSFRSEVIDEVLVIPMRGPHTFTGEDTVEIDCHGGMFIVRRILETLIAFGASMAEPGEYSKRAFLNGKMDLSEAEAVMDMISAQTSYSLRAAVGQLGGVLSNSIEELRKKLLDTMVLMEVNIDYPEYDVPEISDETVFETIRDVKEKAFHLLESSNSGRLLRTGLCCALIGKPNVGKSSWLNLLLRSKRAIVTEIPGTTRDVLEEMLDLDGIPVRLLDTAGLRSTEDIVEKIGVERSYESIESADLVLWVKDALTPIDREDIELWEKFCHKPWLMLLNKTDLLENADAASFDRALFDRESGTISICDLSADLGKQLAELTGEDENEFVRRILPVSAKTEAESGRELLSERIREMFFAGDVLDMGTPLITNLRQKEALQEALRFLDAVLMAEGMPQDLLMIDIRGAYEALGSVNGRSSTEEIITEIFSRFCLGK